MREPDEDEFSELMEEREQGPLLKFFYNILFLKKCKKNLPNWTLFKFLNRD